MNARWIARAIWVGAAVLVMAQWVPFFFPVYPQDTHTMSLVASVANSIAYGGGLAALGAGIYLLGEIRDAVIRR